MPMRKENWPELVALTSTFSVELPGIEPDALPGLLPSKLPVRYISVRFGPVRYLRFRSRVLTASRAVTYLRELPGHNAERWRRPAELDNAVLSGWHLREQPEGPTPADDEAGVSRVENLSSDFYDHLALSAPLLDVGQGIRSRFEGEDPIHNGTNSTGIDERAELA